MSQENVELFKESLEQFNRDDVAGALRYFHPEIRFEHRLVELQGKVTGIDAGPGLRSQEEVRLGHNSGTSASRPRRYSGIGST